MRRRRNGFYSGAGITAYAYLVERAAGEPQTDEQVAEAIQQEQAKPLVIEIPEPATKGTITIYTPDGAVYGYYGEITINSDGSTGQDIDIVCAGYLEGFLEHGEPEYTEESEDGRNE